MSGTIKLTQNIVTSAREKARQVLTEAESESEAALEETRLQFSREADDIIRNAEAEAEGIRRRRLSEVAHILKLREQEEKSKILTDVLNETKMRVGEILSDQARYVPLLVGLVTDGIRELGLDKVVLHVNSHDLMRLGRSKLESKVYKNLGRQVEIKWSEEPIEVIGGVTVSSPDNRIRIINTLDQRFEALESRLLIQVGKLLFED